MIATEDIGSLYQAWLERDVRPKRFFSLCDKRVGPLIELLREREAELRNILAIEAGEPDRADGAAP